MGKDGIGKLCGILVILHSFFHFFLVLICIDLREQVEYNEFIKSFN